MIGVAAFVVWLAVFALGCFAVGWLLADLWEGKP